MKYVRIALALLACCMVSGCTTREGTEELISGNFISGQDLGEDASLENTGGETAVDIASEETVSYFEGPVWSNQTILNAGEEPEIMYRAEGEDSIVTVAGTADTVYAVIADYDGDEKFFYSLIAINRKAADGEELFPVTEIDHFSDAGNFRLGCYHNTLYLLWSGYDASAGGWIDVVYAYENGEDGTVRKTGDDITTMLTDLLAEDYKFCGDFYDAMVSLNTNDRILLWKQGEKVYSFDTKGNICGEYAVDSSINISSSTDGRYLIGTGDDAYYVYDLENMDQGPLMEGSRDIWNDSVDLITVRNGSIYYYRKEPYAFHSNYYDFYRYDIAAGEDVYLFKTETIPGQPDKNVINGVTGFSVRGDNCYFLNCDDGSLWWFSCALSGEGPTVERLGLVQEYRGIFDVGEVVYDHNEKVCEACGRELYAYYIESVILSTEEIPCAEQINEILREAMETEAVQSEKFLEECYQDYQDEFQAEIETGGQEYLCNNNHVVDRLYETKYFDGVTQYTVEREGEERQHLYLEVDFSGYLYMGGAHGEPFRQTYLFDLEDGSIVSVGDIFGISEEEYRRLAAEYTVEDYRENGEKYFLSDEDSIYKYAYEHVDFHFLMHLSEEGVVIEYSPYELGPYASGFIPVTIPYEELGIRLVDVYGVNAVSSDGN